MLPEKGVEGTRRKDECDGSIRIYQDLTAVETLETSHPTSANPSGEYGLACPCVATLGGERWPCSLLPAPLASVVCLRTAVQERKRKVPQVT